METTGLPITFASHLGSGRLEVLYQGIISGVKDSIEIILLFSSAIAHFKAFDPESKTMRYSMAMRIYHQLKIFSRNDCSEYFY